MWKETDMFSSISELDGYRVVNVSLDEYLVKNKVVFRITIDKTGLFPMTKDFNDYMEAQKCFCTVAVMTTIDRYKLEHIGFKGDNDEC